VKARNALIVEAVKIANSFVEPVLARQDDGASHAAWTRAFSIAMDNARGSAPQRKRAKLGGNQWSGWLHAASPG
jgi:hypothetical protein